MWNVVGCQKRRIHGPHDENDKDTLYQLASNVSRPGTNSRGLGRNVGPGGWQRPARSADNKTIQLVTAIKFQQSTIHACWLPRCNRVVKPL